MVFRILGSPECSTLMTMFGARAVKNSWSNHILQSQQDTWRSVQKLRSCEALCSSQRSLTAFWRGWGLALGKCFSLAKLHRENNILGGKGAGSLASVLGGGCSSPSMLNLQHNYIAAEGARSLSEKQAAALST